MSTETAPVCPHCGEPLETIQASGVYAYVQDYRPAADSWNQSEVLYDIDRTAYYTCGHCEQQLPAETVAHFPIPQPEPAALAIFANTPSPDRLTVFAPIARALIDAAAVPAAPYDTPATHNLAEAIDNAREALQLAGLWEPATCPDCNGTGRDSEGERCAHQCPEIDPEPACGACEDTGRDLAGFCDCNAGDARRMRDQEDADQSAEDRSRDR